MLLGRSASLAVGALVMVGCASSSLPPADTPRPEVVVAPSPEVTTNPDARLRFTSGFEEGVTLGEPFLQFGQQWRQELRGPDRGFDWATALPGSPANFQYLVSGVDARSVDDLKRFVDTRIETVEGHEGRATRALYQAVHARGTIGSTQNDFILFDMQRAERGYLRYWIKLQPDLLDVQREMGDWRVLLEWKETPTYPTPLDFQYRWLVMLTPGQRPDIGPVWKVEGDIVLRDQATTGTAWTDDWTIWNRDLAVPIGRWFLLEAFWIHHPSGEGRLLVKVDGAVVADHHGRTQLNSPRGKLYTFEVYPGEASLRRGPAYQWVNDFELWSDLPYIER